VGVLLPAHWIYGRDRDATLVFLLGYPLTTNSPRVNMALYFA
jgi:hypothetical protein